MEALQNKGIVTREMQVRAITDAQKEKRQAEFIISSETPDTYGTVFRMDGWDLSKFKNNPVVLYGHRSNDADPDNVIGTGEVFKEGNKLVGRVTFEDAEVNPKAEKIYRKVQAGTLRMASIGANPTQAHFGKKENNEDPEVLYFDRQELLEFSIVPIGSNPDALKRSAEVIDDIKKTVTRDISCHAEPVEAQQQDKKLLTIREAQLIINKSKNVQ